MALKKTTNKRSAAKARSTSATLDAFTASDVDRWDQLSAADQYYHNRIYYDLEAQRATHYNALCSALRSVQPITVTLDPPWYRVTDWTWNLSPLSSAGSLRGIGGRFNLGDELDATRGKAFPCLYIAEDETTARLEKFGRSTNGSDEQLSTYEFALRTREAFVTFPLEGHVDAVLDLRTHTSLKRFVEIIKRFRLSSDTVKYAKRHGFPPRSLITTAGELRKRLLSPPSWRHEPRNHGIPAPNQIFGSFVRDAGFDAILYPSQQGGRLCLAIFPQNFSNSTSIVRVVAGRPPPAATHILLDKDNLCL